ncbi:hypothetical protein CJ179_47345 [Rhodococcus sp. ACS1]|nr:hypothetical protein CJ179_47345 [Rhodococcus sp. ACS1]
MSGIDWTVPLPREQRAAEAAHSAQRRAEREAERERAAHEPSKPGPGRDRSTRRAGMNALRVHRLSRPDRSVCANVVHLSRSPG